MMNLMLAYLRTRIVATAVLLFVAAILFATKASALSLPGYGSEVFFAHNSSVLSAQGKEAIQKLIDHIAFTPEHISISARAEISENDPQKLSEARLKIILTQMLQAGIAPQLIHAKAHGSKTQERYPNINGQETWRFRQVVLEAIGWFKNSPEEKLKLQSSYAWLRPTIQSVAPDLSEEQRLWSTSPYLFYRTIADETIKNNFARRMLLSALLADDEKTISLFADHLKNCSQIEVGSTNPYLLAIIVGSEVSQNQLVHCKPKEWVDSTESLRLLISQYCADGQRAKFSIHNVASNLPWGNSQIQSKDISTRDILDCAKYSSRLLPWLVENGADLLQPDQQNLTALDHAMMQGNLLAIQRLLDHTKPSRELAQRSLTRVGRLQVCIANFPCREFSQSDKQSIREKLLPFLK